MILTLNNRKIEVILWGEDSQSLQTEFARYLDTNEPLDVQDLDLILDQHYQDLKQEYLEDRAVLNEYKSIGR